ncbi:uncharacterized protein LOC141699865 [Apium graveolens]|uniref:uncharacterized protein LOC141699865 n=1 Tax=Apium graveolens TaxID=4045 RepID=UPI003D79A890
MASTSVPSGESQSSITPVFDGEDYVYWKIKMKTVLRAEGLCQSTKQASDGCHKTNFFKDFKGNYGKKKAWKILEAEFHEDEKVGSINLQALKKDFQNLKMKESENIQSYHARVMEIVNQMRTYGDDISDQHVVEKILISLTDKYENIVDVIEETKDLTKLSVKELMGSLQAHEKRRFKQKEKTENTFQSKTKVKAQPFTRKGGTIRSIKRLIGGKRMNILTETRR